jgi:hypothetical protein
MSMNRTRKLLTVWLGCFAILLAALAPSISHALAFANQSNSFATEICTAEGLQSMGMYESHDSSPTQHDLHFEDCPFCSTHAASAGLVPSPEWVLPFSEGMSIRPALFYQSPHPLFIWAAAQSRAPPSRS